MSLASALRALTRRGLPALALAAAGFLCTGAKEWTHGPQSTFDTEGPVAASQLHVFWVTVWVTLAIFVIVAAVLAYATIKFKAKGEAGEKAPTPPQGHGNPFVELGLIAASVGALVIIAIPTLHAIWYTYDVPEAEKANAYEVNAIGYQWWFKFEYPAEQIDGAGALVAANELVIPAGRPIRINLRTNDVIHSFWVPKLAGKVDMMPNRANHMWLQADQPGYFWGQCAEYCGESHAVMRFRVIALPQDEFTAWVANQKLPARTVTPPPADAPQATFAAAYTYVDLPRNAPGYTAEFDADPLGNWRKKQAIDAGENPALIAEGRKAFKDNHCVTCHKVRGHEGVGVTGPDLTRVGSRTTIAGGLLENSEAQLHRWIVEPQEVKPGNKMWHGIGPQWGVTMTGYVIHEEKTAKITGKNIEITEPEARALVAYLHSLK